MLRSAVAVSAVLILSMPAFADPAASAPKAKKVCHAVNNGNPLFPTYRCTTVPVETAAVPAAPAAPADPAATTQVALQNGAAPH